MRRRTPSKKELERSLARLRKISTSLGRISCEKETDDMTPDRFRKLLAMRLAEQAMIVDRFISLSRDREILERFTQIVEIIETKNRQLEETDNLEQRCNLRKEVLKHIEEWINCLELIITGVISQASQ